MEEKINNCGGCVHFDNPDTWIGVCVCEDNEEWFAENQIEFWRYPFSVACPYYRVD